ncbi:L,D-transpeptidase [Streptomyces sp. ISL-12]|uniref:L,D-transpeptidase n=1 Tax=Streptomyces sp. ISL-12 TaxID=2819177 RepID=UPI001BE680E3|nr:L,D-transpeptidase [Streptomyces sp. ISL-12]MBT2409598.1 L,D-transpeptidase [Streptomyces sp. ISL-12]
MSITTGAFRRRLTPVALTAVLLGGAAVTAAQPAEAAKKPSSGSSSYYLLFNKNWSNPANSRLYLMKKGSNKKKDTKVASWRAGSGTGNTNACASNKGWLPNGTYDIEFKSKTYNGSKIKGYVVKLENKYCAGKRTKRTDLFIHSEMRANGKQGSKQGADSPWRWDGNRDYKSNGCIKMRPSDIKSMFSKAGAKKWPRKVRVVS